MGLLSRFPNPASRARAKAPADIPAKGPLKASTQISRARIRLRPQELKDTNRITPKEQLAGYAVTSIAAVTVVFVAFKGGLNNDDRLSLPLMAAALIGFAICTWKTNRLGAMLGALGVFAMWAARFPLDVLFGYPLMGYMLYLTLVSTKARQKIQTQRLKDGDLVDGTEEARSARASKAKKPDYATSDGAGKPLPPKSSRYTPPKAQKNK